MTTVSEAFTDQGVAAAATGSGQLDKDSDARATPARARARVEPTPRVGQGPIEDVRRAWVWTDAPPSLMALVEGRLPATDRVPSGSAPMHRTWVVWNVIVAVPTSAVLYTLAWVLQHPARTLLVAVVAGPIAYMWIK